MIAIRGWGLAGHLGATARTFVTGARAGQLTPRAPVGAAPGSVLGGARARWLDDAATAAERARRLAIEALRATLPRDRSDPILLVVAWPEHLGEQPTSTVPDHRLLRAILEGLDARLDPSSLVVRGGRAAFARALSLASDLAQTRGGDVHVGAVDTPIDIATLERLDAEGRLAGPQRSEGCIPGEAAAFLALSPTASARRGATLGRVEARGAARGGTPGAVLARVAGSVPGGPERVLHDANGERDKSSDWFAISSEAREALGVANEVDWLKRTGDAGTATGAVLAAIALESALMGDGARERAVVSLLSDDGARGAFALSLPARGGCLHVSTAPRARSLGRGRRAGTGTHAAAACRAIADIVDEVAGLLLLDPALAAPRLASQLDAAIALARPGPRASEHADLRGALDRFSDRSPPVARAAAWIARHLALPPARRAARPP